jgi:hypothetical protein
MNNSIKYKWLLLTAIWALCLIFCYMNVERVNSILDARERKAILEKDTLFWKQNTGNIKIVTEQEKNLTHEIESLKLGIVFLDDTFNRLGVDHNLTELKVEMDTKLAQDNIMPVNISFKGTLKEGLEVIKKLQTEHTFLSFKRLRMEQGLTGKLLEFEILIDYRYRIIEKQVNDSTGDNT